MSEFGENVHSFQSLAIRNEASMREQFMREEKANAEQEYIRLRRFCYFCLH